MPRGGVDLVRPPGRAVTTTELGTCSRTKAGPSSRGSRRGGSKRATTCGDRRAHPGRARRRTVANCTCRLAAAVCFGILMYGARMTTCSSMNSAALSGPCSKSATWKARRDGQAGSHAGPAGDAAFGGEGEGACGRCLRVPMTVHARGSVSCVGERGRLRMARACAFTRACCAPRHRPCVEPFHVNAHLLGVHTQFGLYLANSNCQLRGYSCVLRCWATSTIVQMCARSAASSGPTRAQMAPRRHRLLLWRRGMRQRMGTNTTRGRLWSSCSRRLAPRRPVGLTEDSPPQSRPPPRGPTRDRTRARIPLCARRGEFWPYSRRWCSRTLRTPRMQKRHPGCKPKLSDRA